MEAERSSLFGRERDALAVLDLLGRSERLVTLIGAGGVGKTRLALHVATRRREASPEEPVFRVDLRGATSGEDAAAQVAAAAGVPLVATAAMSSIDQVGVALEATGAALLVLDELDHLVSLAEATVGRWLAMAPRLRCLVASRQALGIHGELRHEVAPLAEDDALDLFIARIQAVAPGFVAHGPAVDVAREIVRRLDCLPLAIELAAARSVVLAPEDILGRLDRRLDFLRTDAPHRIGARHSSLREALDWSWSLLPDEGRQALAALSVFEGGFAVAAAVDVIGGGDGALDVLASLRERSLLATAGDARAGESRHALLESVRELAAQKLDERGERDAAEARHAAHFLLAGEAWASAAYGPDGARMLDQLRREAGNLVRAGRAMLRRDPETSVRIALALGEALALSGPPTVQLPLLDDAVAAAGVDPGLHARALLQRGDARAVCGRRDEAADDLQEAARQARAAGDVRLEGRALRLFGILRRDDGDFDVAQAHLERAAALLQAGGDQALLGHAIGNLATLYRQQGRAEAARSQYLRALDLHRDNADRGGQGLALAGLGHLEAAGGRAEDASALYREALPLLEAVGDRRTIAVVTDRLALLAIERGEPGAALPLLDAAGADLAAVGDRRLEAVVIVHRAIALALVGRSEEASAALDAAGRTLARVDDARIAAALRLARGMVDALGEEGAARRTALERTARAVADDAIHLAATPGQAPFVEYLGDLRRVLDRTLARGADASAAPPGGVTGTMEVGPRSAWIALDGQEPVRLAPLLARLVDALVEERLARSGMPLGPDDLATRVWPGETLAPKLAGERIYGVVARLRRLGLETVVVRQSGGYVLHPAIRCVRVDRDRR